MSATPNASTTRPLASAIKSRALIRGTFVTKDLQRVRRFFESMMGFECVQHAPRALLVREAGHRRGGPKHGQPYWVLEVREVDQIGTPQHVLNHWGMDVDSKEEVDHAYETLKTHAEAYGIARIQKPRSAHNSYSFYFSDVDGNWWEIEHREPEYVYEAIRRRGDWSEGA